MSFYDMKYNKAILQLFAILIKIPHHIRKFKQIMNFYKNFEISKLKFNLFVI